MDFLDELQKEINASIELGDFVTVDEASLAFNSVLDDEQLLNDDEAFQIIESSMNYMYTTGEIGRLREMAMVLGAAACTHDHLQDISARMTENYADSLFAKNDHDHDGYNHDDEGHNHDEDDEDAGYEWVIVDGKLVRRKKKKKHV